MTVAKRDAGSGAVASAAIADARTTCRRLQLHREGLKDVCRQGLLLWDPDPHHRYISRVWRNIMAFESIKKETWKKNLEKKKEKEKKTAEKEKLRSSISENSDNCGEIRLRIHWSSNFCYSILLSSTREIQDDSMLIVYFDDRPLPVFLEQMSFDNMRSMPNFNCFEQLALFVTWVLTSLIFRRFADLSGYQFVNNLLINLVYIARMCALSRLTYICTVYMIGYIRD